MGKIKDFLRSLASYLLRKEARHNWEMYSFGMWLLFLTVWLAIRALSLSSTTASFFYLGSGTYIVGISALLFCSMTFLLTVSRTLHMLLVGPKQSRHVFARILTLLSICYLAISYPGAQIFRISFVSGLIGLDATSTMALVNFSKFYPLHSLHFASYIFAYILDLPTSPSLLSNAFALVISIIGLVLGCFTLTYAYARKIVLVPAVSFYATVSLLSLLCLQRQVDGQFIAIQNSFSGILGITLLISIYELYRCIEIKAYNNYNYLKFRRALYGADRFLICVFLLPIMSDINSSFFFELAHRKAVQKTCVSDLATSGGPVMVVNTARLSYRDGPSASSTALGSFSRGQNLVILEERDGWARIGNELWVSKKYLDKVYDE